MRNDLDGRFETRYEHGDVIVYFLTASNVTMNIIITFQYLFETPEIKVIFDYVRLHLSIIITKTCLHCVSKI